MAETADVEGITLSPGSTCAKLLRPPRECEALTLKRCPACDYSLEGLPQRYRCPECGFDYDESMFVLYGWARAQDRPIVWRLASLGVFTIALVTVAITRSLAGWRWERFLFPIVFVAAFVEGLRRYRMRQQRGGEVQFAFSLDGASQRRGPGKPEFFPWASFRRFRFRRAGRNAWRLRLDRGWWSMSLTAGSGSVILGGPRIDGVIECSRRDAAVIRREIRRRWRAARATSRPDRGGGM